MNFIEFLLLVVALLIAYSFLKKFTYSRLVKSYMPDEVAEKLRKDKSIILLDVRTPSEHKQQNIEGSLLIPLNELNSRVNELEKFRNNEIICYCRSGNRSLTAAAKLSRKGFRSANMKGGIINWNFKVRK